MVYIKLLMFSLYISQFHLLRNFLNNMDEPEGPITPKEKFALIWLLLGGIVIGTFFLIFFYIFATTYEFKEFSIEFGRIG